MATELLRDVDVPINFDAVVTTELRLHERVYLWRRKHHLRQPEAADRAGVSKYQWRMWETGEEDGVPSKFVWTGQLQGHQWLEIWRRRVGWSVTECAAMMGISHVTLLEREAGYGRWGDTYQWWFNLKLGDQS